MKRANFNIFNKQVVQKIIKNKKLGTIKESYGEDFERNFSQLEDDKDACTTYCLLANDDPFLLSGFEYALSPHFDYVITAQNGR